MKRSGFTIIEVMIVIAMCGILVAVIVPYFSSNKKVTCFSGEKIVFEGFGKAIDETSGCTVFAQDGSRYRCTACSERKN